MKRFSLLVLFFIGTVMTLHAATYCAETITSTNSKHTAKITCSSLGDNRYQFVFVSTDAFTSYNTGSNFYMNVNGAGGYQVSAHLTQTGNTLTATIESNKVPDIYVGDFYVNYSSDEQAHFSIPTDADFSQTCSTSEGGGTEPPFDPNTNLALGKPVVAGASESESLQPSNITDGNINSRWSSGSAEKDKDWVYIDLGASYLLSEVDIYFEDAYSKDFVIQGAIELPANVSDDSKWKELFSFSGEPIHTSKDKGGEAAKNAYMVSGVARYVRIRSYDKLLSNISIWEVRVYGKVVTNLALGKPVVAGQSESTLLQPSCITDGNLTTRWSSGSSEKDKDWVYIDLGDSYRLGEVDIYFEDAYSKKFVIQGAIELPDEVSDDTKWETLYSFSGEPNHTPKKEGGEAAKNAYMVSGVARYVRIRSYDKLLSNISIWEVRVYGKVVTNVALNKPVVAGHYDSERKLFPSYITDGNLTTRWSSLGSKDDHSEDWVYIDLGASYRLSEVDIYFEDAYSKDFVIQGANELPADPSNDLLWEKLFSFTGTPNHTVDGGEGAKNAYMVSGVARYVRIHSYDNSLDNKPRMSIWEVRVYGTVVCTYSGGAGDGQTGNGYSAFTKGYELSLGLHETKDSVVVVKAKYLDDEKAEHAYMHNYGKDLAVINQIKLDREGDTQVFSQEIPFSSFTNADGMICFGVKFEIPGSMRVTTPEYFYLDGLGCAERIFTIYHYDDKPEDGAVTEYKGGRILQPIQYKRKFKPGVWETLCVPFEVNSITVTDNDGTYPLYAQYEDVSDANTTTTVPGHFWLREFRNTSVRAEEFQDNWYDIQAANEQEAKPEKNKPYIMRVPRGNYYEDKYIVFHGAGGQEIAKTYEAPAWYEEDGYFSYSGNNTMKPCELQNAYVLDEVGEYFRAGEKVTLNPFECAVYATQATTQTYRSLRMSSPQITTDHGLPSTEYEGGRIYTTMGVLVGTFETLDEEENCVMHLPEGIYIVQRRQAISKIHISK